MSSAVGIKTSAPSLSLSLSLYLSVFIVATLAQASSLSFFVLVADGRPDQLILCETVRLDDKSGVKGGMRWSRGCDGTKIDELL